jgi:hypothetical protein
MLLVYNRTATGPKAESSSLQESWKSLGDATRVVVEQLTLRVAELQTENVALRKSLQRSQQERPNRHVASGGLDSEDSGDSSEDEGAGKSAVAAPGALCAAPRNLEGSLEARGGEVEPSELPPLPMGAVVSLCFLPGPAGEFGGAGVALRGFMDGMDIPARPELYFDVLEAMRKRTDEDGDGGVLRASRDLEAATEETDEEDEEDDEEKPDEDDEEDDEDPFCSLVMAAPLPDITEHPCEVRRCPSLLCALL